MRRIVGALVGCGIGMAAATGFAAEAARAGFYGTLSAGGMLRSDVDATSGGVTGTFAFDPGFSFGAAAGYRFANGFRLEGEFTYGRDSFDQLSLLGTTVGLTGDIDSYGFTGGLFYDFRLGGGWTPYVGAGAGATHQSTQNVTATVAGTTLALGGSDSTDFTAFGEIGIAYALSSRVELVPAYRFQYINDGGSGADDSLLHHFKIGLRISL